MFSRIINVILTVSSVLLFCSGYAESASSETDIPYLKKAGKAVQLIVDNEPFVMLAGEVHNSSSSSLEYMEPIWDKLVLLNLNTVLAPVTWQQTEPEEGKFDFRIVDGLINAARAHNLRLVFLWFGSWKNTISCYVPDWVKKDTERFKRIKRNSPLTLRERWGFGKKLEVISPFCEAACEADKQAFAALMRHIREVDGDKHTVIMVQVENETGILGDSRDRSLLSEEAFSKPVPSELLQYLQNHKDSILPELREIWAINGFRTNGNWTEVFGDGPYTDEIFMAWHIGRYVDEIAKAGKAEYALPMFVNAWLINEDLKGLPDKLPEQLENISKPSVPLTELPGEYPSGGPVSKMMDVWRAAAPNIDILAPDIYISHFKYICSKYTRSGNPLLIPEANRKTEPASKVLYAVAEYDAICFAPFGIDNKDFSSEHPLGRIYKLLNDLMHVIGKYHGTEKMRGFLEFDEENTTIDIGDYRFNIDFKSPYMQEVEDAGKGCGLIIATTSNEFLITGLDFLVTFASNNKELPHAGILSIEEGRYENEKWVPGRVLNGDETGHGTELGFPSELARNGLPIRKVRLYCFK